MTLTVKLVCWDYEIEAAEMTIVENMNHWGYLRSFRKPLHEIGPFAIGLAVMVWMVLVFGVLGAPDADYGGFISLAD